MNDPDKCSYCQGLQREIAACKCSGGSGVVVEEVQQPLELTIEKGIPLPTQRATYQDTFRSMDVNDCVFVAGETTYNRFSHALTQLTRKGYKFTRRRVEGGIRIWRTE